MTGLPPLFAFVVQLNDIEVVLWETIERPIGGEGTDDAILLTLGDKILVPTKLIAETLNQ